MNIPKVGDYVKFDIVKPDEFGYAQYNAGNVVTVAGDNIVINQKETVYGGISYDTNRIRVRDWKYDIEHKLMVI